MGSPTLDPVSKVSGLGEGSPDGEELVKRVIVTNPLVNEGIEKTGPW
jgi:hypothetical protein